MNNKYYVIKESDLMDLLYSAYMLTALNKGEVDEWSKYTQSILILKMKMEPLKILFMKN